jgi:octopine/nopaline transport system substrate-binding protein
VIWTLLMAPAAAQDVLRIGTYANYPPWTIRDDDGTIRGFEIDMINDLCRRMAVQCTVNAVDFVRVFDDLEAGVYDIYIGGMTATAERMKRVEFSQPYAAASSGFMTMADNPLALALSPNRFNLDTVEDRLPESLQEFLQSLRGYKLAVHVSTIQERFAETYLHDGVDIIRYTYEQAMYDDLLSGKVDAVMATSWSLYNFVNLNRDRSDSPVLFGPILAGGLLGHGLAAALRRGNQPRLAALNLALSAAKADGTLARLSLQWFGYNIAPD